MPAPTAAKELVRPLSRRSFEFQIEITNRDLCVNAFMQQLGQGTVL